MRDRINIVVILNFITAICFFFAGMAGDNKVSILLGFCWIATGVGNLNKKDNSKKQ